MAANKKPRKAYKPKGETKFGGLPVIAGRVVWQAPLSDEQKIDVLADYYAAIDAFTQGRAEYVHFEKLVYAANVTCVLADMGMGDEHQELIFAGMAAVQRIKERKEKTGVWGIDGEGRRALHEMEDLHRAQLEIATRAEIDLAIKEMWRRIHAGVKFDLEAA